MRPLEILTSIFLAVYTIWPHNQQTHHLIINVLPVIILLVLLIHLVIEGYRWQMVPLYLLTIMILILHQLNIDFNTAGSILTFILLAASIALPVLLPVPIIPKPSGPLQVGTTTFALTDTSRKELYSEKDEARQIMVQVWYPANPKTTDKRAPWVSNAKIFAPAISSYINLPSFFLDHLGLVKIPAYQDTQPAPSKTGYPVILFSHGWNGFSAQNTGQALELASHGYVVIGVQHTYGAVVTIFPDGKIAYNNPKALPDDNVPTAEYETTARILVNQWAGDLSFTLDHMEQQYKDPKSPFFTLLDLSKVGAYGHSTGGGAAIQFCGTDTRCKALLGMDPFMRPISIDVLDKGTTQPAFFMFSQTWRDDKDSRNNELFSKYYPHLPQNTRVVFIENTAHYDFTDLPLLSPLAPQLGLKGSINGQRVIKTINDYLLSFFESNLRGKPANLFEDKSTQYPEVHYLY